MSLGAIDNFQETSVPVPPSAADLLVGNTLFVSTQGLGGAIEDLTYHYNDIDAAISALTSNSQTIVVYPGAWTVTVDSPMVRLKLFLHPGAIVTFNNNMATVASLEIGGFGIIEFNGEWVNCADYVITCRQFSQLQDIGNVEASYRITASDEISFNGIAQTVPLSFNLEANAYLNIRYIIVDGVNSFNAKFNATDIAMETLSLVIDESVDCDITFTGSVTFTTTTNVNAIGVLGTAYENTGTRLRFIGNVTCLTDNSEAVVVTRAIFNLFGFNFTHQLATNDVSTQDVAIFRSTDAGGFIFKNCNIKSINAERALGIIICDTADAYVQIDDPCFEDVDNSVTTSPDLLTMPAGSFFNGLSASYSDNFGQFFDPLNITNNFPAGTALLARLANFKC